MTDSPTARLFGAERVVFWREVASGASRSAYFVGKNLADLPRLLLVPAVYLSLFSGFSGASGRSSERYLALLAATFATSGVGYAAGVSRAAPACTRGAPSTLRVVRTDSDTMRLEFSGSPSHKILAFFNQSPETRFGKRQTPRRSSSTRRTPSSAACSSR